MIESLQQFALVDSLVSNWDTIRIKLGPENRLLQEELQNIGVRLAEVKSPDEVIILVEDTLDLLEDTPAYSYVSDLLRRSQIGVETTALTRGMLGHISLETPPPVELAEASVVSGRLLGNVLGDEVEYCHVDLYFATNREEGSAENGFYLGKHHEELHYGLANVTIPVARHRLGKVEKKGWWNPIHDKNDSRRYIVLHGVEPLSKINFESKLEVSESSKSDLLVFIHGYNVSFEEAAHRAAQFAFDMNFGGQTLLFSWPSQGKFSTYMVDEERAALSAELFGDFLKGLEGGPWKQVHIVAHSMGNRVLLHGLAGSAWPNQKIEQVVFVAADVYVDVFKQKFNKIREKGGRYSSYVSRSDRALLVSRILHQGQRIGYKNGEPFVVQGLETVDATGINTSLLGLGHSYFGDKRSVLKDLSLLIRENMGAKSRGLRMSPNDSYWLFPK